MKYLLFLILAFCFSSCANKALFHSSTVPKSVFRIEQAAILSPNEKNWYLMQNDTHSLVFVKKFDDDSQTAVISAQVFQVGSAKNSKTFLQNIADLRTKQDDKNRFKILTVKNDQVKFKELPCLKYQTLSEDHMDKGINSKGFEYFKTNGYVCRYPLETAAFQFEVSHRSMGKEIPQDLLKVAEEVFQDIQLSEPTVKKLKTVP